MVIRDCQSDNKTISQQFLQNKETKKPRESNPMAFIKQALSFFIHLNSI